jgi:Tfp pilus assembly protein PilE
VGLEARVVTLATFFASAYRQYGIGVARMDAQREMLGITRRLERCLEHADNTTLPANALETCVTFPQTTPEETYRIAGSMAADTFLLTATPLGLQARDAKCGVLTLSLTGERGITGKGTIEGCWPVRPN